MHITDGIFNPINPVTHTVNVADVTVLAVTWAITIPFLILAWKKTKAAYNPSITSTLAILSAFVFVAQLLSFPAAGGTSVHILGGTLIAVILGPFPAILSMSMVLFMQALFFGDGGFLAFGANAFNMAIIGGLSYFMVKRLTRNSTDRRTFATGVFIATLTSALLCALATGLEIGVSSTFTNAGGIMLTVPTMAGLYLVAGTVEAGLTSLVATTLAFGFPHLPGGTVPGLKMLRGRSNT
jgi:cobalt/nickel transport system permease protein